MAEINLKRFVDIDIQSKVTRAVSGTRNVMVLYTPEGTGGNTKTINSLTEAETTYTSTNYSETLKYLKVFFNNGGVSCSVIEGKGSDTITADDIKNLPNEYIVVSCVKGAKNEIDTVYANLKSLATTLATDASVYGINEKIIVARTVTNSDETSVKNFGVKYSKVEGAEMTIGAYLTQINVYKQDTVKDYSFTQETIVAESLADADFETIINNNMNVDIMLVDAARNAGGNLKDGSELTNSFVKIVLHQTLTERLTQLLVQKIKNSSGISQIYSIIAQELEFYKSAGYITLDKVWNSADLDVSYNGETYTIVQQGTALINGYVIKVLPISSLTEADKSAHKAPPIYVVLADQYGIRQITINGEVI